MPADGDNDTLYVRNTRSTEEHVPEILTDFKYLLMNKLVEEWGFVFIYYISEQLFSMDISSDEADDWFMESLNTWVAFDRL